MTKHVRKLHKKAQNIMAKSYLGAVVSICYYLMQSFENLFFSKNTQQNSLILHTNSTPWVH